MVCVDSLPARSNGCICCGGVADGMTVIFQLIFHMNSSKSMVPSDTNCNIRLHHRVIIVNLDFRFIKYILMCVSCKRNANQIGNLRHRSKSKLKSTMSVIGLFPFSATAVSPRASMFANSSEFHTGRGHFSCIVLLCALPNLPRHPNRRVIIIK